MATITDRQWGVRGGVPSGFEDVSARAGVEDVRRPGRGSLAPTTVDVTTYDQPGFSLLDRSEHSMTAKMRSTGQVDVSVRGRMAHQHGVLRA